jgi:hypothetical protein
MYVRSITEQAELIMTHLRSGRHDAAFLANHAQMITDLASAMASNTRPMPALREPRRPCKQF